MSDKTTDDQTEEKPTEKKSKPREISGAYDRLVKSSTNVPHPGTVRVTIFPNPRE
ncbi:MAG: hypothetical protein R6X10_02375 [Desulfobacterales bacterium]